MPEKLDRQTYSILEVAQIFGIGRNQAYEAAQRGDFPAFKIGNVWRSPRQAIDRMAQEGPQRANTEVA